MIPSGTPQPQPPQTLSPLLTDDSVGGECQASVCYNFVCPERAAMNVATEHLIESQFETLYQRDYAVHAPDMRRLYENAKRDQWNVSKDIDWSQTVEVEKGIFGDGLVDG